MFNSTFRKVLESLYTSSYCPLSSCGWGSTSSCNTIKQIQDQLPTALPCSKQNIEITADSRSVLSAHSPSAPPHPPLGLHPHSDTFFFHQELMCQMMPYSKHNTDQSLPHTYCHGSDLCFLCVNVAISVQLIKTIKHIFQYLHVSLVSSISFCSSLLLRTAPMLSGLSAPSCKTNH